MKIVLILCISVKTAPPSMCDSPGRRVKPWDPYFQKNISLSILDLLTVSDIFQSKSISTKKYVTLLTSRRDITDDTLVTLLVLRSDDHEPKCDVIRVLSFNRVPKGGVKI